MLIVLCTPWRAPPPGWLLRLHVTQPCLSLHVTQPTRHAALLKPTPHAAPTRHAAFAKAVAGMVRSGGGRRHGRGSAGGGRLQRLPPPAQRHTRHAASVHGVDAAGHAA